MTPFARPHFTRTEFVVGAIAVLLQVVLLTTVYGKTGELGTITKSIANCRQIILTMRLFAHDEGGVYPDAKVPKATDSNTVFRQLIIVGSLEDEKIFDAGQSPFMPDGVIGNAPDYAQAIEPNENHWAVTKGASPDSPDGVPLVFENPGAATWPPTWSADAAEVPVKGRAWKGGKIIIGTNDTSVQLMKLASVKGANVPLKSLDPDGLELFAQANQGLETPKYSMLDVAWTQDVLDARMYRYQVRTLPNQYGTWIIAVLAILLFRRPLINLGRMLVKKFENSIYPGEH